VLALEFISRKKKFIREGVQAELREPLMKEPCNRGGRSLGGPRPSLGEFESISCRFGRNRCFLSQNVQPQNRVEGYKRRMDLGKEDFMTEEYTQGHGELDSPNRRQ